MKRLLLLLPTILFLSSVPNLHAQQTQDALYIYRNDGGFNAFFFRDIQRIAYSKVDTLGVEQEDYVVQEVYAMDSVFRIPMSAIDSVAFVTPETKYKQDVAHTTESDLWNYVTATDSVTWLLLRSDTPSAIIPKVGDKIVTLNQTNMLPAGFVGRVASVQNESGGIRVNCGAVNLTEVFDQYVSKVDAYVETDNPDSPDSSRPLRSEQSAKVPLHLNPMAKTLHLTASYGLIGDFSIDGNAYIGVSIKPTIDMRLFLSVGFDTGVNFDCTMRGELETQLQFGINGIVTGHFDTWLLKAPPIPIAGCPLVTFNAELGLFVEVQGSLNIGGAYTSTDRFYSLVQFNSLLEGGRQATASMTHVKDTLTWSDMTAKVTLNVGGYLKKCIEAINADISETGIRSEMGLRAEVEAPINWGDFALTITDGLVGDALGKALLTNQERSRKLYDLADLATVTLFRFSNVQTYTKMLNWTFTKKWEKTNQLGAQMGLVPHLGKPVVRLATEYNKNLTVNLPMGRELLFPVMMGLDIYDSKNQLVKQIDNDVAYFGEKSGTLARRLIIEGLPEAGRYKAFPRMNLFSYRLYSEPTDSFSAAPAKIDIPQKRYTVASSVGHVEIPVNTTIDKLKFTPTANWLTYSWNSFDHVLTVYYETLPTGMNDRKGSIQIVGYDGDGSELAAEEVEITQVLAFINLNTTELNVGVEGGASVINITSTNCKDLKATTKSNFLHPDVSGSTVSILVDPNPSTEAREGTVIVSGLLESVGVRVERIISVTQDGTMTPKETKLFDDSQITFSVKGIALTINPQDGTTVKQGNFMAYKSGDTKVNGSGDNRTETSWQIDLYVDPKDNNMMIDYQLVSGSVSYLQNHYWTTGSGDDEKKHQRTTRCAFNVKDMPAIDVLGSYMRFYANSASKNGRTTEAAVTDFSYETEEDGKQTTSYGQADINADGSLDINLYFAEGVPVLDANISLIETDGEEGYCHVNITTNDVVQKVEKTTSHDWLTVEDENFYTKVSWTTNTSKADREGYVYLTGTLADGSTITRTITVRQKYERIWDDEWNITEDQKAELPSEAVLTELRNHGMPLYLGTEPPLVSGVFKVHPLELVYGVDYENSEESEDETEDATYVFNITSLTGASPKAKLQTYEIFPKYNYKSPASEFFCYYGGEGNHFTLSNITTYKDDNPLGEFSVTYATIVSGEIDGNQVKNLHYAYVDLGENGDKIGAMAIVKDGDGVSTTTKWDPGIEEDDDDDDWDD